MKKCLRKFYLPLKDICNVCQGNFAIPLKTKQEQVDLGTDIIIFLLKTWKGKWIWDLILLGFKTKKEQLGFNLDSIQLKAKKEILS